MLRHLSQKMFVGKPKLLQYAMRKSQDIIGTHSYIVLNADPTNTLSETFPIRDYP